jgi:hypothetical protein
MAKSDKTWLWIAAIAGGVFIVHDLLASQNQKNAITALNNLASKVPSNAATAATPSEGAMLPAGAMTAGTGSTAGLNSLPWDATNTRWDIPRASRGFRN